jgi:hypothetical protein
MFRPHLWPFSGRCTKKNTLQKPFEPTHKFKTMRVLQYTLKYKIQIKIVAKFKRVMNVVCS